MKSKYNSTENLKTTYYLGAGASYNALPIWNAQGNSMVEVSNHILDKLNKVDSTSILFNNEILKNFANKLTEYGRVAVEFGSIDIYARRLHLLGDVNELNELKYCLSVYFDLWENFIFKGQKINSEKDIFFDKIDKRYLSLLSVILEKTTSIPKLNNSVSFVTWNYDLQVEMSYNSFLPNKSNSFEDINLGLSFMDSSDINEKLDVIHLNGYRGIFKFEDKIYSTVKVKNLDNFGSYLTGLLENYKQFKDSTSDYRDCIKYAWESDSKSIEKAKKIMRETDILIIIGYSFPSFNRKIDSELIREFEKGGYHKIIYQDPNANQDIINSIFRNPVDVQIEKINTKQFYIPHEFLSPSLGAEISFGLEK
jgi:hypothetical protein